MTAALNRATEALRAVTMVDPESTEKYSARLTRAALSAALTDPDAGRDPVAGTMREHRAREMRDRLTGKRAMRCLCLWQSSWQQSDAHVAEHEDHVADAIRAAILGGAQ